MPAVRDWPPHIGVPVVRPLYLCVSPHDDSDDASSPHRTLSVPRLSAAPDARSLQDPAKDPRLKMSGRR